MIHLDTSFLIDFLRESDRGDPGPASRLLGEIRDEELGISVFVASELAAGAALSKRPAEKRKVERICSSLTVSYPDERFPAAYASLLSAQVRGSGSISTMDLLIATSAVIASATLVTRNAKDFERVPGLGILDY
jgi:tRNA(fMet)-specific endonuclease VapC